LPDGEIQSETQTVMKKLGGGALADIYRSIQNYRVEGIKEKNQGINSDLKLLSQLK
jgi:hypothetical protein